MSSGGSQEMVTEVIHKAEVVESECTIEPPMEEWTSLLLELPEENVKKLLAAENLYHAGSGEVCTKYISMSDSAILAHPFYCYPSIKDPGIKKALYDPPDVIVYPDDGQELYTVVCSEMNQCPVRMFQRGLLDEVIDLRYYGVNPIGVRAMAIALQYNRHVKVLDLTDNFLTNDACYHLGQMLSTNSCLRELNLAGCRIGHSGALRLFAGLSINRALEVLNINRNDLGDVGIEHLSKAVLSGVTVKNVYLSKNNISGKGITALTEALGTNNNFVTIDLSWNNLYTGLFNLLSVLAENKNLQEVYLAWNSIAGLRNGLGIQQLLLAPKLSHLDLSNNKLSDVAITKMIANLGKARSLKTLNLSYNPISQKDALTILKKLALPSVRLKKLVMENVTVDQEFMDILETMNHTKAKKDVVVIYGSVEMCIIPKGLDPRDLVLNRAEYLTKRNKKTTSNIALIALELEKEKVSVIDGKELCRILTKKAVPLDPDLVDEISIAFPGPRSGKGRLLNVTLLVEFIKRKWPDIKLPPTPPPEPVPEPEPVPVKGKDKQKGKK